MSSVELVLSTILPSERKYPRCAAVLDNDTIIIGSTDGTIQQFDRSNINSFLPAGEAVTIHEGCIYSLMPIPHDHPILGETGGIVSGGGDKNANISLADGTVLSHLHGHTAPVEGLTFMTNEERTLVTGGWDGSVRGWRGDECIFQDDRNMYAVQVLALPGNRLVTGSGNKALSIYEMHLENLGSNTPVLKRVAHRELAHNHTIRKLILCELGIVSCGNDGFIKIWDENLDPISSICGWVPTEDSPEFIYDIIYVDGYVVATGDNRLVKVFNPKMSDAEPTISTIELPQPARTLYKLPNNDVLAVGASGAYILTCRGSGREATPEVAAILSSQVQAVHEKNRDGVDLSTLPTMDVLLKPDVKQGQTKIVNIDGRPMVVMWNSDRYIWELVGEAMGQKKGPKKQSFQGKEYDHVVDVELEPGLSPLQLPFNKDDDPLEVASAFIAQYNLPADSLMQIANFIEPYIDRNALERRKQAKAVLEEARKISELGSTNWVYVTSNSYTAKLLDVMKAKISEFSALQPYAAQLSHEESAAVDNIINFLASFLVPGRTPATSPSAASLNIPLFSQSLCKVLQWPMETWLPVLDLTRILFTDADIQTKVFDPVRMDAVFMALSQAIFTVLQQASQPTVDAQKQKKIAGLATVSMQILVNYIAARVPSTMERDRNVTHNPIPQRVMVFISAVFASARGILPDEYPRAVAELVRFTANLLSWFNRNPVNVSFNDAAYRDGFMTVLLACTLPVHTATPSSPIPSTSTNVEVNQAVISTPALLETALQVLVGTAFRVQPLRGVVGSEKAFVERVKALVKLGQQTGGNCAVLAHDLQKLVL